MLQVLRQGGITRHRHNTHTNANAEESFAYQLFWLFLLHFHQMFIRSFESRISDDLRIFPRSLGPCKNFNLVSAVLSLSPSLLGFSLSERASERV